MIERRLRTRKGALVEALRRAVLTLWQTNLVRDTRLAVLDEVANGISYYDYTFLRELPASTRSLKTCLSRAIRPGPLSSCPRSCALEAGSGVTATAIRSSRMRCCAKPCGCRSKRALQFYLEELHLLGAELSLDGRLVAVSDDLAALAERSPDRSPNRRNEPYRRAISGIYARLAATAWVLDRLDHRIMP